MLFLVADAHTHTLKANALVSREPWLDMPQGYLYSVGIHPWHLREATSADWKELEKLVSNDNVLAVGECGMDTMCGVPMELQTEAFERHIRLSEDVRKPLIVHDVRSHQQLISLHKKWKPIMPWVIHGFRGKPQLADMLLREGFYLSFGEHFSPASVAVVPSGRLLVETDESHLSIEEIAGRVNKYYQGQTGI